jgi:hypothetical protein
MRADYSAAISSQVRSRCSVAGPMRRETQDHPISLKSNVTCLLAADTGAGSDAASTLVTSRVPSNV